MRPSGVERVLLDDVIETDYAQFDLVWGDSYGFDGDSDRFFAGQVNGIAGAASGQGLYLCLGRRSGGSSMRIVLLDGPPGEADATWEDVVEVSVAVPTDRVMWSTWAGETGGDLDLPAGDYRARMSCRGRDAGRDDELADDVIDFYLLELWPAPAQPDEVLRTTSQDAAYWHREWGGRRG